MDSRETLCREIVDRLLRLAGEGTLPQETTNLKLKLCAGKTDDVPDDAELLAILSPPERELLLPILRRKPVRALSGVSVVAVMTAPFRCPHGTCFYCPGGIGSPFGDTPQSYTGLEPAARRGKQSDYDARAQTAGRIANLEAIGHSVSKIELIVMGGTFPAFPEDYQDNFIKGCFDGANGFPGKNLQEAIAINELAPHRIVGLTVETKPDWCLSPHVARMLSYGATRVELGVQTLFDDILAKMNRGHTVDETAEAFKACKDAGLKVVAHMMPFLPGSSLEMDLESFRLLYEDERFKPDELKIYPTQVLPGTGIHKMWKAGNYKSPTIEETIELISQVKEITPRLVRIKRILRDIPSTVVESGTKKSDIRDIVQKRMKAAGRKCQCIRCREIGRAVHSGVKIAENSIKLNCATLRASGAEENFLTFDEEQNDLLVGLLRLRLLSDGITARVRELHVYGWEVPVRVPVRVHVSGGVQPSAEDLQSAKASFQHKGYGGRLLAEAERIAKERGFERISVTSGVGVREYYRKLGYSLEGTYMVKKL
ncbi:MAG: tRNA uridine(34) 5-carboxymethylaminomethyl modification radical SAM/GNAT enzyme Elp3 [archaeon]